MITVSVCMIVKNEEEMLGQCLESLKPIADEIIIVDTGSTDRTKEIAAEFTDKIYDFTWIDDFSAARNFAFEKATTDYIYTADADELLDDVNTEKFRILKQAMLPEIEIVQMYYLNLMQVNTAYNSKRELRPKLFKRLRNFEWINPIHETVRLTPNIFDSDIEIMHLAKGNHAKRDFATFQKAVRKGMRLDVHLHSMYAKELFIAGDADDLAEAEAFFLRSLSDPSRSVDEHKEAACVLARYYRLSENYPAFFKNSLHEAMSFPSSEICIEIADYFYENGDYAEALCWYYDGIFETEAVISVYTKGVYSLERLAQCYLMAGNREEAARYKKMAEEWEIPETV